MANSANASPSLCLCLPPQAAAPAWLDAAAPWRVTLHTTDAPSALIDAQAGVDDVILVVTSAAERPDVRLLAPLAADPLPGFGERLRALLITRIGPRGAFYTLGAGWLRGSLVVVLPAQPILLEDVFVDLIAPRWAAAAAAAPDGPPALAATATRAPQPPPSPAPPSGASTGAVTIEPRELRPGPSAGAESTPEGAWHRAMGALGLQLGARAQLPAALERLAPLRAVLDGAGELRHATDADGERWVLAGFPDLRQAHSKVLLLSDADSAEDLVLRALHRHPRVVGVGGDRSGPGLPMRGDPAGQLSEEIVGRVDPEGGSFFAREAAAIWLLRSGRVFRWDGRRSTPMGTQSQALATIAIDWAQR